MESASLWSRLGKITEKALELDQESRSEYLSTVCGSDGALRRRAEALVAADDEAGLFLEAPAAAQFAGELLGAPLTAVYSGRRIGPYRVVRPLGAGGVGEVFLAARADDQYERQVAVKVLRHRLGSDDARRRILAERQILARLEHPNIARLYDGGMTEDERPYLVMEYVDGLPVDTYCDRHRLPLGARLELFASLCSAVQFAHQSFVVHRDLKPSNILVTAEGSLKLLDFSIAKPIAPGQDPALAETVTGASPMTLAYASPEQIRGQPVTAASDVHGLGIVLYLLLTGRHPFATAGKPLHEVAEAVCSGDPVAPSRALMSGTPDASTSGERHRRSAKRLAGDLDAITLKALAKRARDRYPSAEQLAADLERHRRRRPIQARPPRLDYRLRKAVSRHRSIVLLAGVASVLILAFVLALAAQTRRADAEAERARRDAASAEEVADFLGRIVRAGPRATTRRELLDRSLERARNDFADRPESLGRVLEPIGVAYQQLGGFDQAAEVFAEGLELRASVHGTRSPEFAETLLHKAHLLLMTGDYATARQLSQRALDISRASSAADELAIARALHMLGSASLSQARFREAERHNRAALRIRRSRHGDQHAEVLATWNNLALAVHSQGRYAEAEALMLESIAVRERFLKPDDPGMAIPLSNLAEIYKDQGRAAEAEPLHRKSLSILRRAVGSDHPRLGLSWLNLGSLYLDSGRLEPAQEALAESQRIIDAAFGARHPWAIALAMDTARLRLQQGRFVEAEELGRKASAAAETFLGYSHPLAAQSLEIYARVLDRLGRTDDADRRLSKVHAMHRSARGEHHPETKKFCRRHPKACASSSAAAQ